MASKVTKTWRALLAAEQARRGHDRHARPLARRAGAGGHRRPAATSFAKSRWPTSADDARQIVAAADKRGVRLGVDYNRRFAFGYRTAKELLDRGSIGTLKYCLLRVSDATPPPEVARSPT